MPPQPTAVTARSAPEVGLAPGVRFLLAQQSPDGAWRSDVYATFKDGTALTPHVLVALQAAADAGALPDTAAARRKASEWLAKKVGADGTIDEGADGLPYPVYTAALSVTALSHADNRDLAPKRDAWLKYLLDRQLVEKNGWAPEDKQYGGWGYYPRVPKKPAPGQLVPAQHLLESNISATASALDALAAAGVAEPKLVGPGLHFALARKNTDGGFHFVYDDPVRNKAGAVRNANGPPRFPSYGSATADGARIIGRGSPERSAIDPAAAKARDWLESHFSPDHHPGDYIPAHERNRDAVYFYYAASVAKTFRLMGVTKVNGHRHWADALTNALCAKQNPDGAWQNDLELVRENDPLLATAYAVAALAECRRARAE
ncbi:hypothetical protein FRUB_07649 [Fimbriiglobus ruber]|uniref:Squalene cyclase C-terminal domain-containing protein n=1 Tax=Fimbriiglobus ruber TaxID=1908690 RepID=A0A225DMR7_9BACT|nr:hypothetical protein FRUB_07649 [Fimbriiglobus ruber]